jgi:hypothetical protein
MRGGLDHLTHKNQEDEAAGAKRELSLTASITFLIVVDMRHEVVVLSLQELGA